MPNPLAIAQLLRRLPQQHKHFHDIDVDVDVDVDADADYDIDTDTDIDSIIMSAFSPVPKLGHLTDVHEPDPNRKTISETWEYKYYQCNEKEWNTNTISESWKYKYK